MKKSDSKKNYVLVTTEHRGVFFGTLRGKATKSALIIDEAQNCIYWSADVRGFLGLAARGPSASCRIGPPVDSLTLYDITSTVPCTQASVVAWKAAPWTK